MNKRLAQLTEGWIFSGELEKDAYRFLTRWGSSDLAEHCRQVAEIAAKLAQRFGLDPSVATGAGYLHDLGRVIPEDEILELAGELGMTILPEEEEYPGMLHSKLSKVMAAELFHIKDIAILDALECHTTLKVGANLLDYLLFVADKLSWEPAAYRPALERIEVGLESSLEAGALAYLQYLWDHKGELRVVHPWMIAGYQDLKE